MLWQTKSKAVKRHYFFYNRTKIKIKIKNYHIIHLRFSVMADR